MARLTHLTLAALLLGGGLPSSLTGCGPRAAPGGGDDGGAGDGGGPLHVLQAIEVTPTNPLLELDLGQAGSQPFLATGRFADGVEEDVSAQVAWTLSNPAIGAMTGAVLDVPASPTSGVAVTRVTATLGGVAGEAQLTVVSYRKSGAQQDFFFALPYQDPAGPSQQPLAFSTEVPALDAFFLMDTTGSMIGEISNLKSSLTGTVIPGIQAEVPNAQFGVGSYEDFPIAPYGSTSGQICNPAAVNVADQPFRLFQAITGNVASVQAAMDQYAPGVSAPRGCGADWPEAGIEALYQAATGAGLSAPSPTSVPPNTAGVGGVGFRAGTLPVIVTVTDAMFHGPGESASCGTDLAAYAGTVASAAHSRAQAKAALGAICARAVGVASLEPALAGTACTGQADLEDFATATGARVPPSAWDVPARPANCAAGLCCTGQGGAGRAPDASGLCPLVFLTDASGTGLGTQIVTGIKMLTRFARFDVTSERLGATTSVAGAPLPPSRTTADFIKAVVPASFTLPPPPPALPNPTYDQTRFYGVTPGTTVRFQVRALNDFVPQTGEAQIFRATIRVLASGCTALDEREVLILVPPDPIVIQ